MPTKDREQPDGGLVADVLPAGRYVSVTHIRHPDERIDVTTGTLAWAQARGLAWDQHPSDTGDVWGGRLEVQHVGPLQGAELDKCESELRGSEGEEPAFGGAGSTTFASHRV